MTQEESKDLERIDVLRAIKKRETITLSTGVNVRLKSVSAMLLQNIAASVPDPEVPKVKVKVDVGGGVEEREEPNPSDPSYQIALERAERDRGMAAMEAMYILGIELVDGVPDKSDWLPDLEYLVSRGTFNLNGYDLDDQRDLEVVYKKFVAVGTADVELLTDALGVSEERIAQAARNFPAP